MHVLANAKAIVKKAGRAAANELNADRMLQHSMTVMVELAEARHRIRPCEPHKANEPLKLLLVGYNGTRNTGADVRVQEMIRQFRHLLGDDHLSLSIATVDPNCSRGYFPTVRQLHMPKVFPKFLLEQVHQHHGVVVAEGSMFKSLFANALCTLMVGALGLARAEHKLAVAYGGEAGAMDASMRRMVKKYVSEALILVRNSQSSEVLRALGIDSQVGTDTAWTFEPEPTKDVRQILVHAGWDEKKPILMVCPINGFWWPVKPSVTKTLLRATTGAYDSDHYASLYFHRGGSEVRLKQQTYLQNMARAVRRIQQEQNAFVCVVGMERLDRQACHDFTKLLGTETATFVSDEWDMHELVMLLRQATWLISSRYHAIVTSMPQGVLSMGVTMDERIRNLMSDRGQPHLALAIDDLDLEEKIYSAWSSMQSHAEEVREGILCSVASNLGRMGTMGRAFIHYINERVPTVPVQAEFQSSQDPWTYLPPLSKRLAKIVADYGEMQ